MAEVHPYRLLLFGDPENPFYALPLFGDEGGAGLWDGGYGTRILKRDVPLVDVTLDDIPDHLRVGCPLTLTDVRTLAVPDESSFFEKLFEASRAACSPAESASYDAEKKVA